MKTKVKLNALDEKIRQQHHLQYIMNISWRKLTRGEKVARVALKTLRFALVAGVVVLVGSLVLGVALGVMVAFGIAGAFADGFRNASRTGTQRFYGHYKW